jgi:hypothetical protein
MKLISVEFLHHPATWPPVEAACYSPRLPVFKQATCVLPFDCKWFASENSSELKKDVLRSR